MMSMGLWDLPQQAKYLAGQRARTKILSEPVGEVVQRAYLIFLVFPVETHPLICKE
jgi:hypothetical protein